MIRMLGRLIGTKAGIGRGDRGRARARARVGVESLETRQVLSGVTLVNGLVAINATDGGDTVHITADVQQPTNLFDDLVRVEWHHGNMTEHFAFYSLAVKSIAFSGGLGGDHVTNDTDLDSWMAGGGGQDILTGGGGRDQLYGGVGDDILIGRGGDDRLVGHEGSDQLFGDEGDDFLYGYDTYENMFFKGQPLSDQFSKDTLDGGSGDDSMLGAWLGTSVINGGDDDDTIVGGLFGTNFLSGDAGSDHIYGGAGLNFINGGTGSDYVEVAGGSTNIVDTGNDNDPDTVAMLDGDIPWDKNNTVLVKRAKDKIVGIGDSAPTF
jgi:Ca2+-binding RTX toxin-like protein